MLTPEQTSLRMRDNEIIALKKKNTALEEKINKLRLGFVELIRITAKDMSFPYKAKMLTMADELENGAKESELKLKGI